MPPSQSSCVVIVGRGTVFSNFNRKIGQQRFVDHLYPLIFIIGEHGWCITGCANVTGDAGDSTAAVKVDAAIVAYRICIDALINILDKVYGLRVLHGAIGRMEPSELQARQAQQADADHDDRDQYLE